MSPLNPDFLGGPIFQGHMNPAKATRLRQEPLEHFTDTLAEFQPYLRKRVTFFGAESVGKTTATRRLEECGLAVALPE
jgi:hypothetical protein